MDVLKKDASAENREKLTTLLLNRTEGRKIFRRFPEGGDQVHPYLIGRGGRGSKDKRAYFNPVTQERVDKIRQIVNDGNLRKRESKK